MRSTSCSLQCPSSMPWLQRPNAKDNSMSKTVRFCSAISLSALASVLAGCAAPDSRVASASRLGDKVQESDIGLATRALAALNSGDAGAAITFAERAVDKSPQAASLRALLGNTY